MEVYPCPICDRQQSRGGVPFHDPAQTKAHIDGAHDAPHKDERGVDYEGELEAVEVGDDEVEDETYGERPGGAAMVKIDSVLAGDDTPLTEVVKVHDDVLNEPQAFGLASGEDVSTLIRENAQLRSQNEDLRRSVEELYEAVDALAERAGVSLTWEERDDYEPLVESEEA